MSYLFKENISRWKWYEADTVTSTNDEIKNIISSNQDVVLSAVHQTGGRGRRGRKWQEIVGNLYFTYTERISNAELSKIVCIIAECLAETIKDVSPDSDVKIKWPNDVFLYSKKVSGILLENIRDDLWAIGIGVNIVGSPQISDQPYQATSLAENGIMLDRTEFLHYYLEKFVQIMQEYHKDGFATIKSRYLSRAMKYKEEISIKQDDNIKNGIFSAMDDDGYLILRAENTEERIIVGDLFL